MRSVTLAALLLLVVGCGSAREESPATAAATAFATAVQAGNGSAACALLIPAARSALESDSGQSCPQAVVEIKSSPGHADASVWGDEARVLMGEQTIFLDHSRAGWRIRAAGCTPQPDGEPYECEVAP